MPFHNLGALVDKESAAPLSLRASAKPSARMPPAGILGSLKGTFGIWVGNLYGGVFRPLYRLSRKVKRTVIAPEPDIVRDLGDGRGDKNGIMRCHDPKDKFSLR